MRKQPCVIYRKWDGEVHHVLHGTATAARRNAAIVGQDFHWHETETWWDRFKQRWSRR